MCTAYTFSFTNQILIIAIAVQYYIWLNNNNDLTTDDDNKSH